MKSFFDILPKTFASILIWHNCANGWPQNVFIVQACFYLKCFQEQFYHHRTFQPSLITVIVDNYLIILFYLLRQTIFIEIEQANAATVRHSWVYGMIGQQRADHAMINKSGISSIRRPIYLA